MSDKWTITHCSTVRSLEELPDITFDELKEAVKKEEERRENILRDRAQELQEQIVKLMRQIENEDFWVMSNGDKLDPSDIWVQY